MAEITVNRIIEQINRPSCLWCGERQETRNDLAPHIARCKVFTEYQTDLNQMRQRIDTLERSNGFLERDLRERGEKIAELTAELERCKGAMA